MEEKNNNTQIDENENNNSIFENWDNPEYKDIVNDLISSYSFSNEVVEYNGG